MSEPIERELKYQGDPLRGAFGASVMEALNDHMRKMDELWQEFFAVLDARNTTAQRGPWHPFTLFGWAPTLRGRWL